jgi:hypothetical protein
VITYSYIIIVKIMSIEHREEVERCVEEFHVQKFWINTKIFDSDSWCCDILCVRIVECYAHGCLLSVIHLLYMLCI